MSVSDMVDHGHMVVFDTEGSFAVKKDSGRKTYFERIGKKRQLNLQLEAPDKANQVVAQVMAEMRETQRQDNQTMAEKVIDGILKMNRTGKQDSEFGQEVRDQPNQKSGFWWAAQPSWRA